MEQYLSIAVNVGLNHERLVHYRFDGDMAVFARSNFHHAIFVCCVIVQASTSQMSLARWHGIQCSLRTFVIVKQGGHTKQQFAAVLESYCICVKICHFYDSVIYHVVQKHNLGEVEKLYVIQLSRVV